MNGKAELVCPSCGSKNVDVAKEERQIRLPFASIVSYPAVVDKCRECEFEGDFLDQSESDRVRAMDLARKESVGVILKKLCEIDGYTMAGMERALELPPRTMMQWKSGAFSAGALALLRMVGTYPWAIEVADAAFDPGFADRKLMEQGVFTMQKLARANNIDARVSVLSSNPKELAFHCKLSYMAPMVKTDSSAAHVHFAPLTTH